jgi:membrane protease subunit HflC
MSLVKNILIAGAVIITIIASGTIFIIDETQQAVVVQFQDPKDVIQNAGLHFKIPFIQDVILFDKRLLDYDLPAQTVVAGDQKFVIVDTFTRYKITDPLVFYRSMGTETKAQDRLRNLIIDAMRSVLGQVPLSNLLSQERVKIMHRIHEDVNQGAKKFGIDVVDVRIRRADLPKQNYESIFQRMRSERDREAKELRAVGTEIAQTIRSQAEKERTVLLAQAQKEAQILKGAGEAESLKIVSEATKKNPKFYSIYKSYETYQTTFESGNSTFILSPKGGFFEHFN